MHTASWNKLPKPCLGDKTCLSGMVQSLVGFVLFGKPGVAESSLLLLTYAVGSTSGVSNLHLSPAKGHVAVCCYRRWNSTFQLFIAQSMMIPTGSQGCLGTTLFYTSAEHEVFSTRKQCKSIHL